MPLKTAYQKYVLDFKFDAGTSRGVLREKAAYFIKIWQTENEQVFGLGECSPLIKLSIDDRDDLETHLKKILRRLEQLPMPETVEEIYAVADELAGKEFPAIRFGLEVALLDLLNGGKRVIFDNFFIHSGRIPINGLIWMGPMDGMLRQISDKISAGYDCIKIKVGSLDFERECDVLDYLRRKYYKKDILLRLDANGAFKATHALEKLKVLERFKVHSIEQPIAAGQWTELSKLCNDSPIDIALDEELIGIYERTEKQKLLQQIQPQYIILKPTLLGGIKSCLEWIALAETMNIGWWLTSALESNIGLNAICQFAGEINATGHQGLGTGQLYHNNIPSPLQISQGHIHYGHSALWDFSNLEI